MSDNVSRFLQAEQTANELVDTLEKLRSQIASYKSAADDLTVTRQHLVDLVEKVETLSEVALQSISTVKTVSAPQILSELRVLSSRLDNQSNTLGRGIDEMGRQISQLTQATNDAVLQTRAATESLSVTLPSQLASVASDTKTLKNLIEDGRAATLSAIDNVDKRAKRVDDSLSTLRTLVVLAILGVAAIAVRVFLG